MTEDHVLVASSVTYYSQDDEVAFFGWLDRLQSVADCHGEVNNLYIRLKYWPDDADLREILALFYQYGLDLQQLKRLETLDNEQWLRDPQKYWYDRMYGKSS